MFDKEGQPHLRLWIEKSLFLHPCREGEGSASSEAVNWKILPVCLDRENPRVSLIWGCELKNTIWKKLCHPHWVSLIWGCELKNFRFHLKYSRLRGQPHLRLWIEKYLCINRFIPSEGSASSEAVNWKVNPDTLLPPPVRVSLIWGCELKNVPQKITERVRQGQPHLRLWIEKCVRYSETG